MLATMLVRFRRFRKILLTEKRDWPERLDFIVAFGMPLATGVAVAAAAALQRRRSPARRPLHRRPHCRSVCGRDRRRPGRLAGNGGRRGRSPCRSPSAAGLRAAGLREVCPKEAIWHFSPFVFTGLHRYAWRSLRRFQIDWQVILIAAPIVLELIRQVLGIALWRDACCSTSRRRRAWMLVIVLVLATVLSVAIPIKIWNSARIEHKLQEQEKLLMTARIEALANQINPHFLFNTLNSISLADPVAARHGAHADRQAVGAAPPPAQEPGSLRQPRARSSPPSTSISTSSASASARGSASSRTSPRDACRLARPEHDSPAAGRKLAETWPGAEAGRRRADHRAARTSAGHVDHRCDR